MVGGEPVTTRAGAVLVDAKGRRSFVTSAGSAPSLGRHLLNAYLPAEHARVGVELAVEYFGDRYPVSVASVGAVSLLRQAGSPAGREHPRLRQAGSGDRGRVNLTDDGRAIDTRHLSFTISPHEECAAEEAVRLAEGSGATTVLTLGPAAAADQLRDCLAMGMDRAIHLVTDDEEWDPQATAAAIVEAVERDWRAGVQHDLLLFGNEAADSGDYQVGIRVAEALGLPWLTGVQAIEVVDGERLRVERDAGGIREVFELPLPAVLAVREGLNRPRYPSIPGRLRARRLPIETFQPEPRGRRGSD